MAFDAYLQQARGSARGTRWVTLMVSGAVHGVLLSWGVAHAFWHVDELAPPSVPVNLHFASLAALPPPPPRVAALEGGGDHGETKGRSLRAPRPRTEMPVLRKRVEEAPPAPPESPSLTQPVLAESKVVTQPSPAATAAVGGAPEGLAGGVGSGHGGSGQGGGLGDGHGAGHGPGNGGKAVFLPEGLEKAQRLTGATPVFPANLAKAGSLYLVLAKICVNASGAVAEATLLKRAEPSLDESVLNAVKGWRYRPLLANGQPAPFCSFVRFEFRGQS